MQPSKYTSGIALVIHIVVGAPVILAASLLLFLGTLFFDDPTKSYAAFALAVGKYLFVFPVSMPWAIIAQLLYSVTYRISYCTGIAAGHSGSQLYHKGHDLR